MVALHNAAEAVAQYLEAQANIGLLRFITCGSVDDGKSTLIGRLLYDSKSLFEDQLAGLSKDSQRYGTTGDGQLDMALLVDGLAAEREQGITIDVAYRFFATDRRRFIVADTPGHEQYTRNMVTGVSTADVAVLLVDARKGVLVQTRRHSYIASLLGIRRVVLTVNKMDLVGFDQDVFDKVAAEYTAFATGLGFTSVACIPVSALHGDNVTAGSDRMPWYSGATLLDYLETVETADATADRPLRMPVQWVNRPNLDFRGFCGTVASGDVQQDDEVVVLPSNKTAKVARIVTIEGDLGQAGAGQAVTLVLDREIDISRGDMICSPAHPPAVADQLAAHVVWMDEHPMLPGRPYLVRFATATTGAQITELKYRIDINSLEHAAAKHLDLNEIGFCNLSLDRPLPFDSYAENRETGSFVIIDRISNATVGCGVVDFPLRRSSNIHWQKLNIDKAARAGIKGHKPCVVWFTGLSGAGKSTIADQVEQSLHRMGAHTMLLDGDNVRHGLNRNLGFTEEDRVENIRRVAEVAKLMVEAGLIVLVSLISPFRSERQLARELLRPGEFLEVFVDTPLELCERRDPKGLYRKARSGQLPNFTGIDSPYEVPESPELVLHPEVSAVPAMADEVIALLRKWQIIH